MFQKSWALWLKEEDRYSNFYRMYPKKKKKNHQMANAWKKINYLGKFARDGMIVTDPWDAKEMVPFFPFLFLFNLFTLDKKVVVDGVRFSSASSSVAS